MRGRHLRRRSGHLASQPLTLLAVTAALGASLASGCSWLYDPDDLVDYIKPEPPPDPIICEELALDALPSSFALLEGVGDCGEGIAPCEARPAILVVSGKNIIPEATIAITGMDGSAVTGVDIAGPPSVTGGYASHLAVPVISRVNRTLANGAEIPLKVTVAQGCPTGVVARDIEWRLLGFDELISTANPLRYDTRRTTTYSFVDVTNGIQADGIENPMIIRSNSTITVGGPIQVSANGTNPGPGGGAGGAGTGNGSGPGRGEGFPSALLTAGNGGGAGFATAAGGTLAGKAAGDPFIIHYGDVNRGSGGGGGAVILGGAGGAGGGGGGTVELSALGATTLRGNVEAKGGNGGGGNGTAGGGGSGGVIVVRGGTKVDARMVFDVAGGTSPASANGGAMGRVRIDAPEQLVAEATRDLATRGAVFSADLARTTAADKNETFEVTLLGSPRTNVEVVVSDIDKAVVSSAEVNFETATRGSVKVELARGYNRICVSPVTALTQSKAGATNCVELANIPNYVAPPDPNGKGKNR